MIVGNGAVRRALQQQYEAHALSHALLLTGAEGVGKTTIAREVAAAILGAAEWPGGLVAHPDFWLEDSESERIGIDRIRGGGRDKEATGPSLQDFLALRAYAGGSRVVIIARAERLTEQAANCLLKTIEEPPSEVYIFVCTAHPERLPATITSRCQTATLMPVGAQEIASWLEQKQSVSAAQAQLIAVLAGGRPGRAFRLASDADTFTSELDVLDQFLATAGTGVRGALRAARALAPTSNAEGRERSAMQIAVWMGFLRDVACYTVGAPELALWGAYRQALTAWAESVPLHRAVDMLERCGTAADQLSVYANPKLCYEVLFLNLFAVAPAPPRVEIPPRG